MRSSQREQCAYGAEQDRRHEHKRSHYGRIVALHASCGHGQCEHSIRPQPGHLVVLQRRCGQLAAASTGLPRRRRPGSASLCRSGRESNAPVQGKRVASRHETRRADATLVQPGRVRSPSRQRRRTCQRSFVRLSWIRRRRSNQDLCLGSERCSLSPRISPFQPPVRHCGQLVEGKIHNSHLTHSER